MTSNDLNLILSSENSDESYIQVPIKKVDFGDFITNLLGQPETIHSGTDDTFIVTHEWLVHVHHLLEQRIKLQANSSLVDFSATIKYEEAPSRKITTANGFIHFNETLSASTASIMIAWTYLVFFPNKPSPEKQEITLRISTSHTSLLDMDTPYIPRMISKEGFISLTVAHTERTWGDDIIALLNREIKAIAIPKSLISRCKEFALPFLAGLLFLAGLFLPDIIEQLLRQKETASLLLNFYPANGSIDKLSVDEKLNIVLNLLNPENQLTKVSPIYKAISITIGAGLAFLSLTWFESSAKSYILITRKDSKEKLAFEEKEKLAFKKKIFSFVIAILAGISGNLGYYWLHLPSH
ncbi:hypothetical protein V2J81_19305 [Pseudomonas alliivorans]|nr:hypothetical protein [Pseudomonas alliivorans]